MCVWWGGGVVGGEGVNNHSYKVEPRGTAYYRDIKYGLKRKGKDCDSQLT